jgi:carbon starvation protein
MSVVIPTVIALAVLLAAYIFHSPRIAKHLDIDHDQQPPAHEMHDGVDYVAAKHWTVLFGHHFASIAGAAPIIGPAIACLYWGYLPALIWIVVGGILFGAVHDFASLTLSAQQKGQSIAALAEHVLGRRERIVFSVFVFMALILVVAVFAAVAGKTLASTPSVVIPTFGLIVVALIVGMLMYRAHLPMLPCSIIGVLMLFVLIWAGHKFPVSLTFAGDNAAQWWTIILLLYGLVASVTPVTLLLQPRDHLAASVLFIGMLCGFVGMLITRPEMQAPAFVGFAKQGAPPLWPMMFVTVACGAISGFHSLVSSGTTSKQLAHMKDARVIGYGGMIMESALSVLAVAAVTAGLCWMKAPEGSGLPVYQDVMKAGGPIKAFGAGYNEITKGLLDPIGLRLGITGFGMLLGITMLKTFVMTTLDSATRITRYMCNELLGDTLNVPFMKNKYAATALVGILAGWLALGKWKTIWPVFGASNQLIASVVFLVITMYLLGRGKKCLFVAIPAILMLVTTLGALTYNTYGFLVPGGDKDPNYLLATVSIILMTLAVYMSVVGMKAVARTSRQSSEATEGTTPTGEQENAV